MVKTLTGPELQSLYQRKKLLQRLVRWNPEYTKTRKNNWLGSSNPPKEPLELVKVYSLTNKYGKTIYMINCLCSNTQCKCRNGGMRHPWKIDQDGLIYPNDDDDHNPHPVFAKYGAFIIGP